ncbi:hypothetical protein KL938_004542 [Ogataea parapolymorpha]|nr:hypothetical protein KL938_004542 [Ogataea parapolymorpha]
MSGICSAYWLLSAPDFLVLCLADAALELERRFLPEALFHLAERSVQETRGYAHSTPLSSPFSSSTSEPRLGKQAILQKPETEKRRSCIMHATSILNVRIQNQGPISAITKTGNWVNSRMTVVN